MNAIITGASRGLGKSLAYFLAEKGFDLVLISSNSNSLQKIKIEIESLNKTKVEIIVCDFTKELDVNNLSYFLKNEIKQLSILINNVGVFEMLNLEQSSYELLQRMLKINLESAFVVSNSLLELLKKQKYGHVFNIGSIVTKNPKKEAAVYTISKFALNGFTHVLRDELKDYSVRVTEIIPGSINTSSWDEVNDVPKNEFIQVEDIVEMIWHFYSSNPLINPEEIVIRPMNRNF